MDVNPPHSPALVNFPSWWNVRQKAAVATPCARYGHIILLSILDSVPFWASEWALPRTSECLGMSTFFRGITETVPSLFRGIFPERNSVPNPSRSFMKKSAKLASQLVKSKIDIGSLPRLQISLGDLSNATAFKPPLFSLVNTFKQDVSSHLVCEVTLMLLWGKRSCLFFCLTLSLFFETVTLRRGLESDFFLE